MRISDLEFRRLLFRSSPPTRLPRRARPERPFSSISPPTGACRARRTKRVRSSARRCRRRSEEHTSELQSLMRISYAVFCLKKKKKENKDDINNPQRTKKDYTQNTYVVSTITLS